MKDELEDGCKECNLSLVGQVIGKHPFYGSLLMAIHRKWTCKGLLDFLTVEGIFFVQVLVLKGL